MTMRLYPTRTQTEQLCHLLFAGRVLYNRALEARNYWYKVSGKSLTYYDQTYDLTELRAADPFWDITPRDVQHDALHRLDRSFKAFFRRVKAGQKPGFPRFKSRDRWNSFTVGRCQNVVRGNRIRVSGITGLIRARGLKSTAECEIIQQRVVRRAGKWFCQLVVESASTPVPPNNLPPVGIDLGLKSFAVASDGLVIDNPRFGRKAAVKLARAHRNVSRTKKGSRNRRKAAGRLQRVYLRVQSLRSNFTHHNSKAIAAEYGLIAVENLTVSGMAHGRFAKSILDACWSQFTLQLTYKAENAGGRVVRVNPAGTSQDCSQCGQTVPKDLSVRVHRCGCGLVLDRDLNAARNILKRALIEHPAAVGGSVMPVEGSVATPLKQEVLTIG